MSQQISQDERILDLLIKINNIISSSISIKDALEGIMWELNGAMKVDASWIQFFARANISPAIAHHGLNVEIVDEISSRKIPQNISDRIMDTQAPIIYGDIANDPNFTWMTAIRAGFHSMLIVPIVCKHKVNGLIGLFSDNVNHFSESQAQTLSVIGMCMANIDSESTAASQVMERKSQQEEILQSQQFLSSLSHELKTPLTAIVASTDLLIEELEKKNDEMLLRLAKNIAHSASSLSNRLKELIGISFNQISAFGIEKKRMDFTYFVNDIIEQIMPLAREKKQSLMVEVEPSIIVYADAQRLEQILLNLISNAIKFTPEGGRIYFRAKTKGDELIAEVQDTGKGIANSEKPKLFHPYYRLQADRQNIPGLALGLSITKSLVELHNGKIWVESQEGKGSTFSFSIPLEKTG